MGARMPEIRGAENVRAYCARGWVVWHRNGLWLLTPPRNTAETAEGVKRIYNRTIKDLHRSNSIRAISPNGSIFVILKKFQAFEDALAEQSKFLAAALERG